MRGRTRRKMPHTPSPTNFIDLSYERGVAYMPRLGGYMVKFIIDMVTKQAPVDTENIRKPQAFKGCTSVKTIFFLRRKIVAYRFSVDIITITDQWKESGITSRP